MVGHGTRLQLEVFLIASRELIASCTAMLEAELSCVIYWQTRDAHIWVA